MEKIVSRLTVLFEEPFWVGIYECEWEGKFEVCKITFGAEPKDYEVYEFLLHNFTKLRFSASIDAAMMDEKRMNPKRMQRAINKQLQETGIGTKAQQALQLQQEAGKLAHRARHLALRDAAKERRFLLHEEKRRKKHRGH